MVNELNTTSLVEIKILSKREFEAERCVTGTFLSLLSICSLRSSVSSAIPKSIKDRPRNRKKESKQISHSPCLSDICPFRFQSLDQILASSSQNPTNKTF